MEDSEKNLFVLENVASFVKIILYVLFPCLAIYGLAHIFCVDFFERLYPNASVLLRGYSYVTISVIGFALFWPLYSFLKNRLALLKENINNARPLEEPAKTKIIRQLEKYAPYSLVVATVLSIIVWYEKEQFFGNGSEGLAIIICIIIMSLGSVCFQTLKYFAKNLTRNLTKNPTRNLTKDLHEKG